MRRAIAVVLVAFAAFAACGTPEEPAGPKLCTDVCGALFGSEGTHGDVGAVNCRLTRIQLTDPGGDPSATLDEDGCVDRCAERARRDAFSCVKEGLARARADATLGCTSGAGPSAELMDAISGCLSTSACTQAELAIGACYGGAATRAIADPATGCRGKLSAWKPCLTCLSGRICGEFCRDCAEACQAGPVDDSVCGPQDGSGGGGGGGAGGGGSGGGGSGGGGAGGG